MNWYKVFECSTRAPICMGTLEECQVFIKNWGLTVVNTVNRELWVA